MSPGPESTHPCLLLYLETAIPCLGFSSKAVQLSAGRILSVCLPAYLDFEYYQLLHSPPSLCFFHTQIKKKKFISVAAPGLSCSTQNHQSND